MDKQLLLEKSDKEIIMILSDKGEEPTLMKSVEKTLANFKSDDLKALIDKMGGNRKGNISKRETFIKNIVKFVEGTSVNSNFYTIRFVNETDKKQLIEILSRKIESMNSENEEFYEEQLDSEDDKPIKQVKKTKSSSAKQVKKTKSSSAKQVHEEYESEEDESEEDEFEEDESQEDEFEEDESQEDEFEEDESEEDESEEDESEEDESEEDKMNRAEEIAKRSFEVGRNPLDTAGLDTDDEEWISNNPDCEDYVLEIWNRLQKEKQDNEESEESEEDEIEDPYDSELLNTMYLEHFENNNIVFHKKWDDSKIILSGKGTLVKDKCIFSSLTENGINITLGNKLYVTNENAPLKNPVNNSNCIISVGFLYHKVKYNGCVMSGLVLKQSEYCAEEINICNEKICITTDDTKPTLKIGKFGIDYNSTKDGKKYHYFVGKEWTNKENGKSYMYDVHPNEDIYQCYLVSKTLSKTTDFPQYKLSKVKLIKTGRTFKLA